MPNSEDYGVLAKSLSTTFLDAPPSCIEFSPLVNDVFVVGTYSLHEKESRDTNETDSDGLDESEEPKSQSRSGSLLVFRLQADCSTKLLQRSATDSAVLDFHFSPHDQDVLATAISIGAIHIDRLSAVGDNVSLIRCWTIQAFEASILVLSLCWCPEISSKETLAVSLSDGRIALVQCPDEALSTAVKSFRAHSLEAWTTTWSALTKERLYSGGDDSTINVWDPRAQSSVPDDEESLPADIELEKHLHQDAPTMSVPGMLTDTRTHTAGVTAILPIGTPFGEAVVTGSYDEYIRVLVPVSGRSWELSAELKLDGGVWRLKLIYEQSVPGDKRQCLVLASCMHAGVRIVEISEHSGTWSVKAVARFEEHESMNYGSDALWKEKEVIRVVSTSFYDRRLCVWHSDLASSP